MMSTINQPHQVQVGNKILTSEQVQRYKRIFNLFDINKDGVLDARELGAVGKVLGYQMQKTEVVVSRARWRHDMETLSILTQSRTTAA